jgi:PAS domain S-box-containing protein
MAQGHRGVPVGMMQSAPSTWVGRTALLAALYFLSGKLGLLLALPPGYATVIWPPSGIALGMLIVYGWRLWPGVLVGSFLLNAYNSGAYSPEHGLLLPKVLAALGIAVGSTLQSVAGRASIARYIGLPLRLNQPVDLVRLFILAGPVACCVGSTVGVSTLYLSGLLVPQNILDNWLAWWGGDTFGVLVFLPLVLAAAGSHARLVWRDRPLDGLPVVAMLALVTSLGVTFYAWKFTAESVRTQNEGAFAGLALENEIALRHRLDSYDHALLGAVAYFLGSDNVSREEWRTYVRTIELKKNFPGIDGMGFIEPVPAGSLVDYLARARRDHAEQFTIHPDTQGKPYYLVKYFESQAATSNAIGFNIAFEANRQQAAELARDSGESTISGNIVLHRDGQATPGFMLLQPMYAPGKSVTTVADRRAALLGWIFSPVVARNFLHALTASQGALLDIRVYDGTTESQQSLVYADGEQSTGTPAFVVRRQINVMRQQWLVVWTSTPAFEQTHRNTEPVFVLVGGLLFTGLLAIFVTMLTVRRAETMEWMIREKGYLLPAAIFLCVSGGAFYLYHVLDVGERRFVQGIVAERAAKIRLLVDAETKSRIKALVRMGQRWEAADGTPQEQWRKDAANYIDQLDGLRSLQWLDSTRHVRWIEPQEGGEKALGLNDIVALAPHEARVSVSDRPAVVLTSPLDAGRGNRAFIAYLSLHNDGNFDGYIAAVFAVDDFFAAVITAEIVNNFDVAIASDGRKLFESRLPTGSLEETLAYRGDLRLYGKEWALTLTPSRQFTARYRTWMPAAMLGGGLLIGALLALLVRAVLVAKLRSTYLKASEETFRSAMESASIGMALVKLDGRFMKVNGALCTLLGYSEADLLANDFQCITHPDDLHRDLDYLQRTLAGDISRYRMEKRYFHKSGRTIWTLLSVSLVRDSGDHPTYFIAQIQDISEQKEVERIKSEFISVVSHELRTPLTSIRGSLGLILGAFTGQLPEKVGRLLDIAHSNCERLILLINDILDIDKIASGKMRYDMQEVSLAQVVHRTVQATESYAQKFAVSLEVEPIAADIRITVDEDRLAQVLSNLLSNAIKFSPQHGRVALMARLDAGRVRLSVADSGPGIPDEFRGRIFEKFSQADSSAGRRAGGTGLGLHITRQIVSHMHGTIGFDTQLGQGTTFWIEFPALEHEQMALAV